MTMEKYEILLIIITISVSGVGFKITLDDLKVFKVFKVKHFKIIFSSRKRYHLITKTYSSLKYYHQYQLPDLTDN